MANSEIQAAILHREETAEALDDLRAVMEKHNLSFEITDYGDNISITRCGYEVKSVMGQITAEDLNDA